MRNIERVILWGLPPSFCALVQRAGRAARDFTKLGEAILIVQSSIIKNGVTESEVELSVNTALSNAESGNCGTEETAALSIQGIEVAAGLEEVSVTDGGVRVSKDSDDEDADVTEAKHRRRK